MTTDLLRSPDWHTAATLTERLAGLRHVGASSPASWNGDLARSRLQLWRALPSFAEAAVFERRLAADGLQEDEFLHLLGEEATAVAARSGEEPEWLVQLQRAFAEPAAATELLPDQLPDRLDICQAVGPLLDPACARVRARAEELAAGSESRPFEPAGIVELLLKGLVAKLRSMSHRTLVLELHVARLQGDLLGDSPAERFRAFQERLRRPEVILALLREYPVLARQLLHCVERWTAVSLEFLEHLAADHEALRRLFGPQADLGPLVDIQGEAGDTHRGGRAVMIVRFQSGLRLVYKPRSLSADMHFQGLLGWLNECGALLPFRMLQVLERGDHGWVEFAEARDCDGEAEVRRFYQRQGAYLALLYALEATDFHCDNLIAAGQQPMLVDLEALFHPRLKGTAEPGPAEDALGRSVCRVCMLPSPTWGNDKYGTVDVSGLGSAEGALSPYLVPQFEDLGTDELRMVRKRMPMQGSNNRPKLAGAGVNLLDYEEEIVAGFVAAYRLLQQRREELLSDDGPLAAFAGDEVRVVLRNTRTYGMLSYESYHPEVLRDALDRDRLLDRLWTGVTGSPYMARLIPAERANLLDGDIPMFTTRPGTRDLWTASGGRVADFFAQSGMEQVRQHLGRLGDEDLQRQVWIIRTSLATVAMGKMPSYVVPSVPVGEPGLHHGEVDREQLLAAARAVGDCLAEKAVWKDGAASWLTMTMGQGKQWGLAALTPELYDGPPGVALFLAHLGRLTGAEGYTQLARAALATTRWQLEQKKQSFRTIGGFEGWGGILYALAHLGALWQDRELFAQAEQLIDRLPPLIAEDEKFDIIAGSAGCIFGLLSLHHCVPSPRTLAMARQCGQRLLERAQPMAQGAAWPNSIASRGPLTGFSHGAAGIAFALLELAQATGDSRFHTQALAAIAYERSQFVPEKNNWANLRLLPDEDREAQLKEPINCLTSWCHGAPGIGLARQHGLRHLDDRATRDEIEVALKTTAGSFGTNHTLCHGDLGNLELLHEAGRILPDRGWSRHANRVAAGILESIERDGWLCATPQGVQTPGLMTGLAGIGYGLLRLAEPEKVPSVLAMAPPVRLAR